MRPLVLDLAVMTVAVMVMGVKMVVVIVVVVIMVVGGCWWWG